MLQIVRLFVFAALVFASASYAIAQPRVATVIGNSDYRLGRLDLANPGNDADLMEATLKGLGFEVVTYKNATRGQMISAFNSHRDRLSAAGPETIGLFYYAGHGVQYDGRNHLLPIDTDAQFIDDIIDEPQLGALTARLQKASNRVNFIILDACNNNPLKQRPGFRDVDPKNGLAGASKTRGVLIAYAAEPGYGAADGGQGLTNSPFTAALASHLGQQGLIAEQVFKRVAETVETATGNTQIPYHVNGLRGADFCFTKGGCTSGARAAPRTVAAPAGGAGSTVITRGASGNTSEVRAGMNEEARQKAEKCDSGSMAYCVSLGVMHQMGTGVSQNNAEAVRLYRKGCEGGDAIGCANLGIMYQMGTGVSQNNTEAIRLYRKGCEGGNAKGCANLGVMHQMGTGVSQNNAEAIRLYRKGCEGGNAAGCVNLGFMHGSGKGVSQDYAEAMRLYRKGCEGGDATGCGNLGNYIYLGRGIVKNEAEGKRLLRQACEADNQWSCDKLSEYGG